jgi:hypothetical protein
VATISRLTQAGVALVDTGVIVLAAMADNAHPKASEIYATLSIGLVPTDGVPGGIANLPWVPTSQLPRRVEGSSHICRSDTRCRPRGLSRPLTGFPPSPGAVKASNEAPRR